MRIIQIKLEISFITSNLVIALNGEGLPNNDQILHNGRRVNIKII